LAQEAQEIYQATEATEAILFFQRLPQLVVVLAVPIKEQ
jgi:hypothetical protein